MDRSSSPRPSVSPVVPDAPDDRAVCSSRPSMGTNTRTSTVDRQFVPGRTEPVHRYDYVDHDFRPDASGWRAAYLSDKAPGWFPVEVAGWLVQIESRWSTWNLEEDDPRPRERRPRRIVAAVVDGGTLVAAEDDGNFHGLIPPGGPDPTPLDVARARRRAGEAAS